ncbi:hypothetical protein [Vibrio porteresiae]|uniref:Uncharacterized protein n=1 Tax=Vibrio porteresiae DSM 19223 TaxID=1123496 RepID=A0ABZ0QKA6_9VIBR|nr:hypothetical protein [Vibrio porteresiae]WPC75856.1 hypothetical protein R8Z52_23360 [Vibrio porteresiae DSM 19223]
MSNLLDNAYREYPELLNKFKNLIEKQSSTVASFPLILVSSSKNGYLQVEAFGKTIQIEFSMVRDPENNFYGQITANYIRNIDDSDFYKKDIYTQWFDKLGNVKDDLANSFSMESLNYDGFLFGFINKSLEKLILSDAFCPVKNG